MTVNTFFYLILSKFREIEGETPIYRPKCLFIGYDAHTDCCLFVAVNVTCPENQFTCGIGGCLLYDFVCDGRPDCLDNADEDPEFCS